jgi:hypothetical protein
MLALRSRRRPPSRLRDDMDAFRQRRLSERRQNPSSGQGEAGAHAGAARSGSPPEHRRFAQNLLTVPIRPTDVRATCCKQVGLDMHGRSRERPVGPSTSALAASRRPERLSKTLRGLRGSVGDSHHLGARHVARTTAAARVQRD